MGNKIPLRLIDDGLDNHINSLIDAKLNASPLPGDVLGLYDNIVAWYGMNETSGTTMTDSHINSLDGTISGATVNQTGLDGQSYLFNGTSDYVSIPHNSLFDFTDTVTILAHVKLNYTGNAQEIVALPYSTETFGSPYYSYSVHVLNNDTNSGSVRFWLNTSEGFRTSNTANLTYDVWHTVIATYDGYTVTISVDDNATSNSNTYGTLGTIVNYSNPLYIGSNGLISYLSGHIDYVGIFDTTLTEAQISSLYNNGNGVSYSEVIGSTPFYNVTVIESYLNDATSSNSGSVTKSNRYYLSGETCTLATDFPNTGSNFIGYANDTSGSSVITSFAVTSSKTVYAIYDYTEVETPVSGDDYGTTGTYFVSSSEGNDSNNGTSVSTPKATIAAITALNPAAGSLIKLKAGDTFNETLTVPTSGSSGSPIVYGAYGIGAKPIISGTTEVTGWTNYSGNIYRASISSDVMQVFIDGEYLLVSRYPQTGYATITTSNGQTGFTSTEIDGSYNYIGSLCYGRHNEWTLASATVTGQSTQTITAATGNSGYTYPVGYGVFFVNALDFMTYAGSWYYDSTNDYLYLWMPDGSDPSSHTIEASVRNTVDINYQSYITIENLNIEKSSGNGIQTAWNSGDYIMVDNCDVNYSTQSGMLFQNENDHVTVNNCTVNWAGMDGVRISYGDYGTITRNNISNVGLLSYIGLGGHLQQRGNGITLDSSTPTDNYIAYNVVNNCGYGNILGAALVEYNYMNNSCLTADDGGAFYTQSDDVVVRYNIVRNAMGTTDGKTSSTPRAHGIYFDLGADNCTATNNVVTRVNMHAITCNGANSNFTCTNNLMFDNNNGMFIQTTGNDGSGGICTGNTTVKTEATTASMVFGSQSKWLIAFWDGSSSFNTVDYNTYYDENGKNAFLDSPYYTAVGDFAGWVANSGLDANSSYYSTDYGAPEIYYNATNLATTITLSGTYVNIDGSFISSFTLQPFTGKVVIKVV